MAKMIRWLSLLALTCALAFPVNAQTPVSLLPNPRIQFFNSSGQPLAGGLVYTTASGTSTPLATYTDSSGTIQNSNPIVLDSGGFASAWLQSSAVYRIRVTDSGGSQQWVVDGVTSPPNLLAPGPIGTTIPSVVESTEFLTGTSLSALSGLIRLASADKICWRNNANSGDVCLSKNSSDSFVATSWNDAIYVDGATYLKTGAGLQAAITAAANASEPVHCTPGTYPVAATITIPSNSTIYWDGCILTSDSLVGDFIRLNSSSNVIFHGTLKIDGTGQTGSTAYGLHEVTSTNFSYDDLEISNTYDGGVWLDGGSLIRGGRAHLTNDKSDPSGTSTVYFGANHSTTPLTDVQLDQIDVNGSNSDCVYFSGTQATPSTRININKINMLACGDSGLELNYSPQTNVSEVNVGANAVINAGMLIRRTTDTNVGQVTCAASTSPISKECVDIGTFLVGDGPVDRVTVGQVTASGISGDSINGSAVRISASGPSTSVSNVVVGNIVADSSTRGFYCAGGGGGGTVDHITLGNFIVHNSVASGISINTCDDVNIGNGSSFDNNQGNVGGGDHGLQIEDSASGYVGSIRVYDDQGGSKTQTNGINIDGSSSGWTIYADAQNALESSGVGVVDNGTGDIIVSRTDTSNGLAINSVAGSGVRCVEASATGKLNATGPCGVSVYCTPLVMSMDVSGATSVVPVGSVSCTMPSSGCPCRALINWDVAVTMIANHDVDFWINDGTTNFRSVHVNGQTSDNTGAAQSLMTSATYANSASVIFTLNTQGAASASYTVVAAPAVGAGANSGMDVSIFKSN